MIKKIILLTILIILNFSFVFAETQIEMLENQTSWFDTASDIVNQQNSDFWNSNWGNTTCTWPNCLNSTEFMIKTKDFTPWNKSYNRSWTLDLTGTTNNLLSTIIQNLMVAIWVIALLVMSIWAWYMIFYHGQDEMLSKWKTMFTTWITALVIALSSYYLVSLVRYILYTWNQ